jgi:hypothetical protein
MSIVGNDRDEKFADLNPEKQWRLYRQVAAGMSVYQR